MRRRHSLSAMIAFRYALMVLVTSGLTIALGRRVAHEARHMGWSSDHAFTIVGSISLIGAILFGIMMQRHIMRPIQRMVDLTVRIANGDYELGLDDKVRTAELYEVSTAIEQMAKRLQQQEALRKQLTSDVAHELRTPVANISSYLEMMLEGVMEPTMDRLESCYTELQRLSVIIKDLERLQVEEIVNVELHIENVDVRSLAETALHNFESMLADKNISAEVSGDALVLAVDRDRMLQVFSNLISNAIKYSGQNGVIRVKLKEQPGCGIITVEDEGIGIPESEREHIFERFYRTDKSRNRKTGGAGIGLSIAKAIISAHHGTIRAEAGDGCGSRFVVQLPRETAEYHREIKDL